MNPGDVIEWAYKYNNSAVRKGEELWSSPMKKWVPISVPALLIGITEDEYTWLSEKGLFHARVDDTSSALVTAIAYMVVPRARG